MTFCDGMFRRYTSRNMSQENAGTWFKKMVISIFMLTGGRFIAFCINNLIYRAPHPYFEAVNIKTMMQGFLSCLTAMGHINDCETTNTVFNIYVFHVATIGKKEVVL